MSSVVYGGTKINTNASFHTETLSSAVKMLKYQNIAPAPPSDGKLPRKYTPRASNAPYQVDQTHSVQRRNARERNRVKQVNNSFAKLRQHIPQTIIADLTKGGGRGPQKKISKVDTLRIAVEYIRRLQDLVDDYNGGSSSASIASSFNLSLISDTASNSSFSSNSTAGSPPPAATQPQPTSNQVFYTNSGSPLPSFQHHSLQTQMQSGQGFPTSLLTPVSLNSYSPRQTQLDAKGCHSPTSSFNSSMSFDSGTFEQAPEQQQQQKQQQQHHSSALSNNTSHLDAHLQLKFEPYDNFNLHEEDCTPDDEEILDYISLWQEQ